VSSSLEESTEENVSIHVDELIISNIKIYVPSLDNFFETHDLSVDMLNKTAGLCLR